MAHETTNRIAEARDLVTRKIPKFLVGIALLLLVVPGYQGCNDWLKARKARVAAEESTATIQAVAQPPAPAPTIIVGQERKLYLFANYPDGVIKIPVRAGRVDFNAKGGQIIITTPLEKKYTVNPGDLKPDIDFTTGTYTVEKGEDKSLGVEVWN